jgi:hypothetical protein
VFVTDKLDVLTSCVLALKIMLRPFTWCYLLAPILPTNLLEALDTPQPILAGITLQDYNNIEDSWLPDSFMETDDFKERTWIFLDT